MWQNGTLPKYAFNAKELDEETGMYYYEARYYKPPVFTSRDPMMDQKPWLTPYHYCSNNPVGRVDPSGMMDEGPEDPPGKKTPQAKPKIEVNIVPQDNLKQKPVLLPIEQPSISSKKGLFHRMDEFLNSYMTGGYWGTAENGQGQETRKGDGPKTDVSGFTSNMPEPNPPKIDRRAYEINSNQNSYKSYYLPDINPKSYEAEGYFIVEYKNAKTGGCIPCCEVYHYTSTKDSMKKVQEYNNNPNASVSTSKKKPF